MSIATIKFTAKPGASCRGCMFEPYRSDVCNEAGWRAVACGLPDCDEPGNPHIYVLADDLVGMVEQGGKA